MTTTKTIIVEGIGPVTYEVSTEPVEKVCGWCQEERGEEAKPNQSHGICPRHKAQWMANAAQVLKDRGLLVAKLAA